MCLNLHSEVTEEFDLGGIRLLFLGLAWRRVIIFSIFEFGVPVLYLLVLGWRSFILCFLSTATLEFSSSNQPRFQQAVHNVFGRNWGVSLLSF